MSMLERARSVVPTAAKLITWLTPHRIALAFLFSVTIIACITVFEQRHLIFSSLTGSHEYSTPRIHVPAQLDQTIKNFVSVHAKVVSFSIVSSHIRSNQSEVVYFYTSDPVLRELDAQSAYSFKSAFPIFSSSEVENAQMISAINGQFACYPYERTFKNRFNPSGASITPYLCIISMPPYYGEFSGFLMFGLKSAPTDHEIDELRLAGTRLSTEIYVKNFRRKDQD